MPCLYLMHGPVECQMELLRLHLLNESFDILGDTHAWFLAERKIGGSIISVFPLHLDGKATVQPAAVGNVGTAGSLSPLQLANCCGCSISSRLMSTTTYECDRKLFYNKLWAGTIPSPPRVLNMEMKTKTSITQIHLPFKKNKTKTHTSIFLALTNV